MINNKKKYIFKLRYSLIITNIILALLLVTMILFWVLSVRPSQVNQAIEIGQFKSYFLSKLPISEDLIKADYIGNKDINQAGDNSNVQNESPLDNNAANEDKDPEELMSDVNQLLEKTNKLLARETNNLVVNNKQVVTDNNLASANKKPAKISIMITNLGLNKKSTELALTLPKQCSLGFLPYTKSLKPLLTKAHNNGHEIYLYLPLQTSKSYNDPGKYALRTDIEPEENAVRLNMILNSINKYKGLYTNHKEIFTDDIKATEGLLDQLEERNLILVSGKGAKQSLSKNLQSHNNVIGAHIIIDEELTKENINNQLLELEKIATNQGQAVGFAQGFTLTINMIKDWAPTLEKRGIMLIPISELLKD